MKLPGDLPPTFTARQAQALGVTRQMLRVLLSSELIERIAAGIYRRADAVPANDDLLEVAIRAPQATLCLETVLARHDLSDLIPACPDIAVPRGTRFPAVQSPVAWHTFSPATFHVGRELMPLDPVTSIGIHTPERAIVDTVRLRHRQGPEVAYQAIRRYLEHPGSQPGALLAVARHFPRTEPELRKIMEILTA